MLVRSLERSRFSTLDLYHIFRLVKKVSFLTIKGRLNVYILTKIQLNTTDAMFLDKNTPKNYFKETTCVREKIRWIKFLKQLYAKEFRSPIVFLIN